MVWLICSINFMEEDSNVPLMLGRSFLTTGRTLVDMEKGELIIRGQDE